MRLWHHSLLKYLDAKRLIRQHCECCALRGNGWGRNHSIVNYVFDHHHEDLVQYHFQVMNEMRRRGYKTNFGQWLDPCYRGSSCEPLASSDFKEDSSFCYPEHDDKYLLTCLKRLAEKNDAGAKSTISKFLMSLDNANGPDIFDAELHKKAFICYCEVIIDEAGRIHYAIPCHQEKMIKMYGDKHCLTKQQVLDKLKDKPMYLDELLNDLKCVMLWYDNKSCNVAMNKAQLDAMSQLIVNECVSDEVLFS